VQIEKLLKPSRKKLRNRQRNGHAKERRQGRRHHDHQALKDPPARESDHGNDGQLLAQNPQHLAGIKQFGRGHDPRRAAVKGDHRKRQGSDQLSRTHDRADGNNAQTG
jgi:hypothetical protein